MSCTIDGCDRPIKAKGLCNKHWLRLWRHGSPTAGATCKGELPMFIEDVSNTDVDECIVWPYGRAATGYGITSRGYAHRLVCEKAHGAPFSGAVAAHSCGNGHLGCVNPRHLRWATSSENIIEAYDHGTQHSGERHHAATIPDAAIPEIISLRGVVTQRVLADRYGVSQTCIHAIQTGKNRARNRSSQHVS